MGDRVVGSLKGLERVWVYGDLAQGLQSEHIECILVGEKLAEEYIEQLCNRVEELTEKMVYANVSRDLHKEQFGQCLLVWSQENPQINDL